MKNHSVLFNLVLVLSVFACTSSSSERENKGTSTDTLSHSISNTVIIPPESGVINVTLNNGEGNYIIRKREDQIIYLTFDSEGDEELTAQIIPLDSNANVRFSQIIFPTGTMDGPFGREFTYHLNQDGEYQLALHEDMMAGEPWDGEFVVKLHLQDLAD